MKIKLSFLWLTVVAFIILLIVGIANYMFGFLVKDRVTIDSKEYFQALIENNKNLAKCNFYFILPKHINHGEKAEFILNAPFKNCQKEFFILSSKVFLNQKNSKKVFKLLNSESEFAVENINFKVQRNEKQIKVTATVI